MKKNLTWNPLELILEEQLIIDRNFQKATFCLPYCGSGGAVTDEKCLASCLVKFENTQLLNMGLTHSALPKFMPDLFKGLAD